MFDACLGGVGRAWLQRHPKLSLYNNICLHFWLPFLDKMPLFLLILTIKCAIYIQLRGKLNSDLSLTATQIFLRIICILQLSGVNGYGIYSSNIQWGWNESTIEENFKVLILFKRKLHISPRDFKFDNSRQIINYIHPIIYFTLFLQLHY